jgi:hypothetical protein
MEVGWMREDGVVVLKKKKPVVGKQIPVHSRVYLWQPPIALLQASETR